MPKRKIFNPFPGLRPFEPEETHLFFGREEQTDELLRKLRRKRFLAVVGASGSGKSSLVRAGMIPAMLGGFMSQAGSHWRVAVMRPGGGPLRELAEALVESRLFGENDDDKLRVSMLETGLRRSTLGLVEAVNRPLQANKENLLLVVDQFEELFRYNTGSHGRRDEARAFARLLMEGAKQSNIPLYVCITMRSDFLGECSRFPGLAEMMNDSQYLVPRLNRKQRQAAISGPVAVGGAELSNRLIQRLLNDVGDNPDHLPILQHAMMRTFDVWMKERKRREPIDIRHYDLIGGMDKALSIHADEIFEELDDAGKEIAEIMFKRLTERGVDGRGIRRPTSLKEVREVSEASRESLEEVIEKFRQTDRAFLMPPPSHPLSDGAILDISHESLMRVWKRLKEWVEEETHSAQIYRRLAETAFLHLAGQAGEYRDPDLHIALKWRKENRPNAIWAKRYGWQFRQADIFLNDSRLSQEAELAAQEEARTREMEQIKEIARAREQEAEAERRHAIEQEKTVRRLRRLSVGLVFVMVGAFASALWALRNGREAGRQLLLALESERKEKDARRAAEENEQESIRQRDKADRSRREVQRLFHVVKREKRVAVAESVRADNSRVEVLAEASRGMFSSRQETEGSLAALRAGVWARKLEKKGRLLYRSGNLVTGSLFQAVYERNEEFRLSGHQGHVYHLSRSPDGKLLASAGWDNTLRIWDIRTGKNLAVLRGHKGALFSVDFSPDGKYIVSGGEDKSVRLWRVRDGNSIILGGRHKGQILSVRFSPDGRYIASGGEDKKILVRDLLSPGKIREFVGHTESVLTLAFSPDGKTLVSGSVDKSIGIWSSVSGLRIKSLLGHQGSVFSLAVSPDGKKIVSGGGDNMIRLWQIAEGKLLRVFEGHRSFVSSVNFSPGGKLIASGSWDRTVRVWTLDGRMIRKFQGHVYYVFSVLFSRDGRYLYSGSGDRSIRIWRMYKKTATAVFRGNKKFVTSVVYDREGKFIASAGVDGSVRLWNGNNKKALWVKTGHKGAVLSLAYSRDGRFIASGGRDKSVQIRRAVDGTRIKILRKSGSPVYSVAFSPDGKYLAAGSGDRMIRIWDAGTGELKREMRGHSGNINSLDFSPDGKLLVSGARDWGIRLWNVADGKFIRSFSGHRGPVLSVKFSPEGDSLVSGSWDDTIRLWRVSNGATQRVLKGHKGSVYSVAISADGETILSGGYDESIIVWNRRDGRLLKVLPGHKGSVYSVAFRADGQAFVSGGRDKLVKVWNWDLGSLLNLQCDIRMRTYLKDNKDLSAENRELCDNI